MSKRNNIATDRDWLEASIMDEIISAKSVRQTDESTMWIMHIIEAARSDSFVSGVDYALDRIRVHGAKSRDTHFFEKTLISQNRKK